MTISLGVDQSANHTGVCVLGAHGEVLCTELIEPKVVGLARLVYVRNALRDVLAPYPDAAIGVWESYSLGSKNRPFLLGEIGGIVQIVLTDAGCQRIEMSSPKALKKFVTGNASATKSEMVSCIENRWHEVFPNSDDNRADAYGLAQIGRHLLDPQRATRRDQREVLHAITHPKKKKKVSFRMNKGLL